MIQSQSVNVVGQSRPIIYSASANQRSEISADKHTIIYLI